METYPQCPACKQSVMVPLSDYSNIHDNGTPAPVHYKSWICLSKTCGHAVRISNGNPTYLTVKEHTEQNIRR